MKQLTQKLMDGDVRVVEVPWPVLAPGQILIQNHFSIIHAGTEGSTVSAARKNLVGKAKERPQQVKQVVQTLQNQGPVQTYRAVMKKLNNYSTMGYSSAGVVLEVAPDVKGFKKGDRVACAGAGYANHAEVVAVPSNLCVRLPDDANLEYASYNTVGAIALQGVRQAEVQLGETVMVIGLGLIGQITCLLLRSAGAKVIGVDIREEAIERARKHSADFVLSSATDDVPARVEEYTQGIGADRVLITAGTPSSAPINLAGKCLRQRGRVVIVGNVSTDFEREDFYLKELDVRMSCSYGPGRYDPKYEERGLDYPVGYVRWTEQRNMDAFQHLIHSGTIDLNFLTTHRFMLDEAPEAYDVILGGETAYCGIVIRYDAETIHNTRVVTGNTQVCTDCNVGFIGAGSYAMNHLLPNVARQKDVTLKGVMTARGTSSRSVAERYGFEYCTAEEKDIIDSNEINTVFIATRHDSHADYTLKALKAGKNVFVEKPLCLLEEELEKISETFVEQNKNPNAPRLMVGFNRRFSPLTEALKSKIPEGPMSMLYRINAGPIDAKSWIQVPEIGGGRIIGEVCHFIDYLTYINGSLPIEVFGSSMNDPQNVEDVVSINLRFANGSIGNIMYVSNGSKNVPKEYIEIHRSGVTAILDDYKKLTVHGQGKPFQKKLLVQDKGQANMIDAFTSSIMKGQPACISFQETYAVTLATIRSVESIRTSNAYSI